MTTSNHLIDAISAIHVYRELERFLEDNLIQVFSKNLKSDNNIYDMSYQLEASNERLAKRLLANRLKELYPQCLNLISIHREHPQFSNMLLQNYCVYSMHSEPIDYDKRNIIIYIGSNDIPKKIVPLY